MATYNVGIWSTTDLWNWCNTNYGNGLEAAENVESYLEGLDDRSGTPHDIDTRRYASNHNIFVNSS